MQKVVVGEKTPDSHFERAKVMRGGGLQEVVSRIGECWWWTGIPALATVCRHRHRHWLAAPAAGVVVVVLIGGVGSTSSYWCRYCPCWRCWFAAAAGVVVGGVSRLWQQQSSSSLWQQQQLSVSPCIYVNLLYLRSLPQDNV